MAKKRVAAPKKKKKKASAKTAPQPQNQIFKILAALAVLVLLVIAVGMLLNHFLKHPVPKGMPAVARMPVPPVQTKPPPKPKYEVYPQKETLPSPIKKLPQLPGDLFVAIELK